MSNSGEADEVILRCRKCRHSLLTRKINEVIGENGLECCRTFNQLQPILVDDNDENRTPDWILACLNENEWRKGKFLCPGCNGKVGAFNFISTQKCACGRAQTPPIYFYKSRIDICSTTTIPLASARTLDDSSQQRDHFAMLKKSNDEEWMVVFDSKSPDQSTNSKTFKSHRKSQSWHASGSSTVSNWLASTIADVSSHLDVAATETKQALVETLDLASSVVAAPVSSAIRAGHRKTKSWSGSIKTTLSTILGGLFSTRDMPNIGAAASQVIQQASLQEENFESSASDHGTAAAQDSDQEHEQRPDRFIDSTLVAAASIRPTVKPPRSRPRKSRAPQWKRRIQNASRPRSRSSSPSSIIPDYLLCSICLDIFCLPRYCLPCRHVFCEPCLKLLVRNSSEPRNPVRVLCPLCRQLIGWTELAADMIKTIVDSEVASLYAKRILDYERQTRMHSLVLPGLYQWKLIQQLISWLPERIARYVETFWVDYTPLVTLYSFCVSLLCLLFFFALFLPGVYLTSWIYKFLESFTGSNEIGMGVFYQEILDLGALIISNGMLTLASVVVIISITLYAIFVM